MGSDGKWRAIMGGGREAPEKFLAAAVCRRGETSGERTSRKARKSGIREKMGEKEGPFSFKIGDQPNYNARGATRAI